MKLAPCGSSTEGSFQAAASKQACLTKVHACAVQVPPRTRTAPLYAEVFSKQHPSNTDAGARKGKQYSQDTTTGSALATDFGSWSGIHPARCSSNA